MSHRRHGCTFRYIVDVPSGMEELLKRLACNAPCHSPLAADVASPPPPQFTTMHSTQQTRTKRQSGTVALGLAALGVVFGDIGTSPLYTLKTVLDLTGEHVTPETVLGVLSLIVWTLIIVTSIKYVSIAMRVDNDGEG